MHTPLKRSLVPLAIFAVTVAQAQDTAAEKKTLASLIEAATVDMPVATAPAAFLLGASGETVQRMGSFRAFSTQAARAFDAKGRVVNAVSVEIAPALAMKSASWSDVTRSAVSRAWARTTLSFATTVRSEKAPAGSAIGFQSLLYAPAMDHALDVAGKGDCVAVANGDFGQPPPLNPGEKQPLTDAEKQSIEACQTLIDGILTKWNQPKLAVGLGRQMATALEQQVAGAKNSTAYWITAAYGGDTGSASDPATERIGYLVTAHARRTSNVTSTSVAGTDLPARQQLIGVNGRFGNARLGGIAEYSVQKSRASGADFKDRKRAVFGIEYRMDKDLYLTVGTARDSGQDAKGQSLLARLHWGFGKEPVLLAK